MAILAHGTQHCRIGCFDSSRSKDMIMIVFAIAIHVDVGGGGHIEDLISSSWWALLAESWNRNVRSCVSWKLKQFGDWVPCAKVNLLLFTGFPWQENTFRICHDFKWSSSVIRWRGLVQPQSSNDSGLAGELTALIGPHNSLENETSLARTSERRIIAQNALALNSMFNEAEATMLASRS